MKAPSKYVGAISLIATALLILPSLAFATGGDVVIQVQDELGNNLSGATVALSCPGGTYTNFATTTDSSGISSTSPEALPGGSSCSNGKGVDVRAAKSGYVTTILASTTSSYTYSTVTANRYNMTGASGLKFGLKVIAADQFGNSVIPLTSTLFRGAATSSSNGATLYWADTTGANGTLALRATGYTWATTTNAGFGNITTGTGGQVVITMGNNSACSSTISASASCKGFEPMIKVSSFQNELGGDVTPVSGSQPFSVDSNLNLVNQILSGGIWYIVASSTANGGGVVTATSTGYVSQTVSSVVTSEAAQKTIDIGGSTGATYSMPGLPFALKVTMSAPGSGGRDGINVTAGNSNSITCNENALTGVYYCAIPTTDTGTTVSASKTGFVSGSVTYTARTLYSNPQSTASLTLNTIPPNIGMGGGGGGGGGAVIVTTNQTIIDNCPKGYVCSPAPIVQKASPIVSSPVPTGTSASFTRTFDKGAVGGDVRRLQTLLASDSSVYPEGIVSGYFGPLTLKAVQAFQVKYSIAKQGDSGYGTVGPKTRAMLLKVFGK